MNIFNPYATDAFGNVRMPVAPPVVRVNGGQLSPDAYREVLSASHAFFDSGRIVDTSNSTRHGVLTDGGTYSIHSVGGHTWVEVWPAEPDEEVGRQLFPGVMFPIAEEGSVAVLHRIAKGKYGIVEYVARRHLSTPLVGMSGGYQPFSRYMSFIPLPQPWHHLYRTGYQTSHYGGTNLLYFGASHLVGMDDQGRLIGMEQDFDKIVFQSYSPTLSAVDPLPKLDELRSGENPEGAYEVVANLKVAGTSPPYNLHPTPDSLTSTTYFGTDMIGDRVAIGQTVSHGKYVPEGPNNTGWRALVRTRPLFAGVLVNGYPSWGRVVPQGSSPLKWAKTDRKYVVLSPRTGGVVEVGLLSDTENELAPATFRHQNNEVTYSVNIDGIPARFTKVKAPPWEIASSSGKRLSPPNEFIYRRWGSGSRSGEIETRVESKRSSEFLEDVAFVGSAAVPVVRRTEFDYWETKTGTLDAHISWDFRSEYDPSEASKYKPISEMDSGIFGSDKYRARHHADTVSKASYVEADFYDLPIGRIYTRKVDSYSEVAMDSLAIYSGESDTSGTNRWDATADWTIERRTLRVADSHIGTYCYSEYVHSDSLTIAATRTSTSGANFGNSTFQSIEKSNASYIPRIPTIKFVIRTAKSHRVISTDLNRFYDASLTGLIMNSMHPIIGGGYGKSVEDFGPFRWYGLDSASVPKVSENSSGLTHGSDVPVKMDPAEGPVDNGVATGGKAVWSMPDRALVSVKARGAVPTNLLIDLNSAFVSNYVYSSDGAFQILRVSTNRPIGATTLEPFEPTDYMFAIDNGELFELGTQLARLKNLGANINAMGPF